VQVQHPLWQNQHPQRQNPGAGPVRLPKGAWFEKKNDNNENKQTSVLTIQPQLLTELKSLTTK